MPVDLDEAGYPRETPEEAEARALRRALRVGLVPEVGALGVVEISSSTTVTPDASSAPLPTFFAS